MRFTIIPADGVVAVDGVYRRVSGLALDPSIHAVQGRPGRIEVEYVAVNGVVPPNAITEDDTPFLSAIAAWSAAPPQVLHPDPVPTAAPRRVSTLDFMERLTLEERAAVRAASRVDASLDDWLDLLRAAQWVDLDDPRTQGGLAASVAAGLLTPERAQEIAA